MNLKVAEPVLNALKVLKRKVGIKPGGRLFASALSDLSNSLDATLTGVEDGFLNLGLKFQSIAARTGDLKHLVLKTADYSGDKGTDTGISGLGRLARESLQTLEGYQDDILRNIDLLNAGTDHLSTLSKMCTANSKVALLLNVVALNIAIESNRAAESREMFTDFVEEVKDISEKISGVSQSLLNESDDILKQQSQFRQETSGQLNRLQALSYKAETAVNQAVETIENMMEKSTVSLQRASSCSEEINSMVSTIVMAMQFHDIVRQQIEHIIMAVNDGVQLYETFCERRKESASIREVMGEICAILMVQNAQLKKTISEIDTVYESTMGAFEGIEARVAELISCVSDSTTESTGGGGGGDLFSIVLSGFKDLNILLGDAYQLSTGMNKAAGEASAATKGLLVHVDHVQKISLDLHRKSLNAIIKAAHLGEMGRALEVFANEVSVVSYESTLFADKVVEHIGSISSLTEQISDSLGDNGSADGRKLSLETDIDSISGAYDAFLENTNTAMTMSSELGLSIAETKLSLSFISGFSDELKMLLDKSEAVLIEIKDAYQPVIADITSLSDRYTMESERLVHMSLLNETEPDNETCVAEKETNESSFELFDAPEQPAKQAARPLSSDYACSGNEKDLTESQDESDDGFDDNIELF